MGYVLTHQVWKVVNRVVSPGRVTFAFRSDPNTTPHMVTTSFDPAQPCVAPDGLPDRFGTDGQFLNPAWVAAEGWNGSANPDSGLYKYDLGNGNCQLTYTRVTGEVTYVDPAGRYATVYSAAAIHGPNHGVLTINPHAADVFWPDSTPWATWARNTPVQLRLHEHRCIDEGIALLDKWPAAYGSGAVMTKYTARLLGKDIAVTLADEQGRPVLVPVPGMPGEFAPGVFVLATNDEANSKGANRLVRRKLGAEQEIKLSAAQKKLLGIS